MSGSSTVKHWLFSATGNQDATRALGGAPVARCGSCSRRGGRAVIGPMSAPGGVIKIAPHSLIDFGTKPFLNNGPMADGQKLKVFISYSRKDSSDFADELVAGLELAGFAPFLEHVLAE
jgi:hypothetical protein